ncbi:MAG: Hsp70 family protein [Bacteroidia bacterium]|nr:Hsp70 family protein [Bacteroidia bacterium]
MYCGLDFGTSNTLCAIDHGEHGMKYISLDGGKSDIPSVAFYPIHDLHHPVYGRQALELYINGEEGRLLRSFKRLLGTKYFGSGTMLTSRFKLKFHDLFRDFIQHVKSQAEEGLDEELSHVVVGRPVRFSNLETAHKSGESDLTKVAQAIGFKEVEFQYEPIAAAFAHESRLSKEQLAMVVDLGGGTSDFSIIRLGPERKDKTSREEDILANNGIALGGTDFDSVLSVGQVMGEFGYKSKYGAKRLAVPNWPYNAASDWNRIALELYLRKTFLAMKNVITEAEAPEKLHRFLKLIEEKRAHHLLKEVESAKIELSADAQSEIRIDFIEEGLKVSVERMQFESDLQEKISSLKSTAEEALRLAALEAKDIELIILTGGASAVPVVRQAFIELFPAAELSTDNLLGSVCEGLLYDARRKFA